MSYQKVLKTEFKAKIAGYDQNTGFPIDESEIDCSVETKLDSKDPGRDTVVYINAEAFTLQSLEAILATAQLHHKLVIENFPPFSGRISV